MTTDPILKRLRWLMILVIFIDGVVTIVARDRGFWRELDTSGGAGKILYPVLQHGYLGVAAFSLAYAGVAFALVSLLPRRLAVVVLFSYVLAHYASASTWFSCAFHYGVKASIIYGVLIALAISSLGFPSTHLATSPHEKSA
jgi:hypothetical protein